MNYWLMKSEPDAFCIDDLAAVGTEPWDGIRNYQARNFMRDGMRIGDQAFFYHSNCAEPGLVGSMRIASAAYPDPTQFDPDSIYFDPKSRPDNPRWLLVDVQFVRKLRRVVTLRALKADPRLADMRLVQRGNRLSIMPVRAAEWRHILKLAGQTS